MEKKFYVCHECGYVFPDELSNLIENKVQVFCEQCGAKFTLPGVDFKEASIQYKRKHLRSQLLSEKECSKLERAIQILNYFSFIPILIFTCAAFIFIIDIVRNPASWMEIITRQVLIGLSALLICLYDIRHILPKVKQRRYNEIFVDSLCYGILGCIMLGIGTLLLIKGVLIFFYVISSPKNKNFRAYDFGLLLKNSLNNFSAKAGFIIILLVLNDIRNGNIAIITIPKPSLGWNLPGLTTLLIPVIVFGTFLLISILALLIDLRLKKSIKDKQYFNFFDSFRIFIIGIFATIFYSAGIFVLLKGILIFFLYIGKPLEVKPPVAIEEKPLYYPPQPPTMEEQRKLIPELKEIEGKKQIQPPIPETVPTKIEQEKVIEIVEVEREIPSPLKEEEIKLKLHESLLPVKDEKDKKLVKQYFTKIFTVLSKDVKKKIKSLKISKNEKKELLEELAFLTKEEQVKYIEELIELQREIPKKLIERIRKLPNVKSEHYIKIVDQLKYMDSEEQLNYVQYLENNA